MIFKKRGFTLLELQMASILMVVVLIATGVIFYFALASIRYLHDAFTVYSSASAAMKAITDEVMVSNCYGNDLGGPLSTPDFSFYGFNGYIHGIEQDDPTSAPAPLSGEEAQNSLLWMPRFSAIDNDNLYLRQSSQEAVPDVAGDFPFHASLVFYLATDPVTGISGLYVDRQDASAAIPMPMGGTLVAPYVTAFDFEEIDYNCLSVRITVQGPVVYPGSGAIVHEVVLGKMITLRCAPNKRPW
ncbi:MAG: type II secretion system GspH family protein [Candidatus Omnitrophica bacterium]|nr:type II secretion system GspH family protein [Candidatus Omnitrophota bacterium]